MRRPREITRQLPILRMLSIIPLKPDPIRQRTPEPHRGRAALHQLVAQKVTRQQFLVRPWLDDLVNQRVPTRVIPRGIRHPSQRLGIKHLARPGKRLADGAGLEVARGVVEVLAARDRDGAQPVLVGGGAVVAGAGERVALARGRLARDLGERLVEVGVHARGVVVVEARELRRIAEVGVARDRVGDLVAEVEVDDKTAVAVVWWDW